MSVEEDISVAQLLSKVDATSVPLKLFTSGADYAVGMFNKAGALALLWGARAGKDVGDDRWRDVFPKSFYQGDLSKKITAKPPPTTTVIEDLLSAAVFPLPVETYELLRKRAGMPFNYGYIDYPITSEEVIKSLGDLNPNDPGSVNVSRDALRDYYKQLLSHITAENRTPTVTEFTVISWLSDLLFPSAADHGFFPLDYSARLGEWNVVDLNNLVEITPKEILETVFIMNDVRINLLTTGGAICRFPASRNFFEILPSNITEIATILIPQDAKKTIEDFGQMSDIDILMPDMDKDMLQLFGFSVWSYIRSAGASRQSSVPGSSVAYKILIT